MQASATQNGTIMQGEYALLEPLPGSAGEVVQGRSRRDGRLVTIRLWHGHTAISPERVLEKPQVAGRLQHPMLATVECCGRESDGRWFIVSEYVAGKALGDWADEVGIPPIGSVVDFMHRLCQGLNAAHREGLSHDALNPGNIIVSQQGSGAKQRLSGKILEIGVPAFMYPFPPSLRAAQFMAPEQFASCLRADGAPLNADARMNVFSCGCLLYYLCTGGAPFPSRSLDELAQAHLEGKLVPPSKINPQLSSTIETVIQRALALQRSERFVNVSELASALSRVRQSSTSSGVHPRMESNTGRPVSAPLSPRRDSATAFDERPTSESRLPSDWVPTTLSAPPPSGQSTPPTAIESDIITGPPARRSSVPARASWAPPAGSFSSAPPVASKSSAPAAVQAAAARAFSSSVPPAHTAGPRRQSEVTMTEIPLVPQLAERSFRSVAPPPAWPSDGAAEGASLPLSLPEYDSTDLYLAQAHASDDDSNVGVGRRSAAKLWLSLGVLVACGAGAYVAIEARGSRATAIVTPVAVPSASDGSPAATPVTPQARPSIPEADRAALPIGAQTPDRLEAVTDRQAAAEERAWKASGTSGHAGRIRRPAPRASSGPRRSRPGRHAVAEAEQDPHPEADEPGAVVEQVAAEEPTAATPQAPVREAVIAAPTVVAEPAREAPRPQPRTSAESSPAKTERPSQAPVPLQATAQIEAVVVRGSLATSVVSRAVARIRPQLTACYARAATAVGRNGFGSVSVEVQVDERGRAQNPRATGGGLPGLAACVAEVAGKLASDRTPDTGTVKASWKVVFVP